MFVTAWVLQLLLEADAIGAISYNEEDLLLALKGLAMFRDRNHMVPDRLPA